MSKPLWHSALETLRARFLAGATSHPGLKCLLVHAGPGERKREDEIPPIWGRVLTKLDTFGDDRTYPNLHFGCGGRYEPRIQTLEQARTTDEESQAWRNLYFAGERAALTLFQQLATAAGICLESLPPERTASIAPDSFSRSSEFFRWACAVYDLAWSESHPVLAAPRRYWDAGNEPRICRLDYLWSSHVGPGRPDGAPDYYFAELTDVFMASVYAIDLLLDAGNGSGTPTPPAAQQGEGASPQRRRRRAAQRKPPQLTDAQMEAAQLVGEHKGNITAAAKAAGKTRQALGKLYRKAMEKLGKQAVPPKPKTQRLATDSRGQETDGRGDDRHRKPIHRSDD
jgi:DNA-binding CsgD family transcriptional regulator